MRIIEQAGSGLGLGGGRDSNMLLNPFKVAQRQTRTTLTGYATGSYGIDRWHLQHNAGTTAVQLRTWWPSDSSPPVDFPTWGDCYGEAKNNSAGACGILLVQPIEAAGPCGLSSVGLRGQTITFQILARVSSGTPTAGARIAEWTGTADSSSAKSEVASWSSNVPTFNTTTRAAIGTPASQALSSGAWTQLSVTATVGASANNLCCSVWVEGIAAGASLYLANPALSIGPAVLNPWSAHPDDERAILRYFQRIQGNGSALQFGIGSVDATGQATRLHLDYDRKRIAPSISYSAANTFAVIGASAIACSSIATVQAGIDRARILVGHTATTLSPAMAIIIGDNNSTSATIDIDAEL